MKIVKKVTLKYLKLNKKKSLATAVGITLSTALLFAVALIASTINQNNLDYTSRNYGTNHVSFNNMPYSTIEVLNKDKNIKEVISEQIVNVRNLENCDPLFYGECYIDIIKLSIDYEKYLTLTEGVFPKLKNEIIVSKAAFKEGKLELLDMISEYKIVGVFEDSYQYNHSPQYNYSWERFHAFTSDEINQEIPLNYYVTYISLNGIFGKIFKTADDLNLKYTLNQAGHRLYDSVSINSSYLNAKGHFEVMSSGLLLALVALAIISLVLSIFCIFVIYNAFNISLLEKKKHLAILRSIGATKKQIRASVRYEARVLSIICVPLGIIISFIFVGGGLFVLNRMLEGTLDQPFKLSLYFMFVIISLIFILVTIFVSASKGANEASEITPIEALKGSKDIYIKKFKKHNLVRKIFGPPGELAYKNIQRNKSKYKVTVISLCISMVLFMTFSIYLSYLVENLGIDLFPEYDIQINISKNDKEEEIIKGILALDYIDESILFKQFYPSYKSDKTKHTKEFNASEYGTSDFNGLTIYGIEKKDYNNYLKKLKINDKNQIIFNNNFFFYDIPDDYSGSDYEKYAKEIKVFNDSNIKLDLYTTIYDYFTNSNREGTWYFTLENFYFTENTFFKTQNGPAIVIDMSRYNEIFNEYKKHINENEYFEHTTININSKQFKQFDVLMTEFLEKYQDMDIGYTNVKLENYDQYMQIQAIKFVLYSIVLFITLVGLTSAFNTINTNIYLRKREFTVLRSVGLSKKDFNKMVRFESVFLALKTLSYGIPISLGLFGFWTFLYYLMTDDFKIIIPTNYFIVSILSILLIIFITMWYTSRKIRNKNIIDSIREENI